MTCILAHSVTFPHQNIRLEADKDRLEADKGEEIKVEAAGRDDDDAELCLRSLWSFDCGKFGHA